MVSIRRTDELNITDIEMQDGEEMTEPEWQEYCALIARAAQQAARRRAALKGWRKRPGAQPTQAVTKSFTVGEPQRSMLEELQQPILF